MKRQAGSIGEALLNLRVASISANELGALLRIWRDQHGLSQQELADKIAVSAQFICDVEKGRRGIGLAVRERLERVVGV